MSENTQKRSRRTEEERIAELDRKMQQLQHKKQLLAAQVKTKERKERTRRLIQIGALFEKVFDVKDIEEAEKLMYELQRKHS